MKIACACLAGLLAVAAPAFAATDNYVSTSNTGSCATTAGLKGFFEATSFGFSGTDATNVTSQATGAGAGKLSFDKFQLLKKFDSCSGVLLTEFLQQSHIPTVILESKTTGASSASQVVLTITLSNAVLTQYSLTSSAADSTLQENLAFQFQKACITTAATVGAKGTTLCFDTSTNRTSAQ